MIWAVGILLVVALTATAIGWFAFYDDDQYRS